MRGNAWYTQGELINLLFCAPTRLLKIEVGGQFLTTITLAKLCCAAIRAPMLRVAWELGRLCRFIGARKLRAINVACCAHHCVQLVLVWGAGRVLC